MRKGPLLLGSLENGPPEGPPEICCTDPEAANYDPLATCDDGSCVIPEEDCENAECLTKF
eukprot:1182039-Prorocentrum_minimum.AAC.1